MLAQLGAEGTRRYTIGRDGIYAINGAMKRFEALATPLLADRKGSEESLSELQETRVFQTNFFGGLSLDAILTPAPLPYQIWTVIAVYAEPELSAAAPVLIGTPNNTYLRTDMVLLGSGKPVHRMTMEQLAVARNNKFMPGNERTAATRPNYGYYITGNRSDNNLVINGDRELIITPRSRTSRTYVGMSYLRTAASITTIDVATNIPYPSSLFIVLRNLALNEIAVKQGDNTTLYQITEREIGRLLGAQN